MSNIREVAKLAGVSVATVSRTYADPGKVSPATRKQIEDVAAQLNWQPNDMARLFRSRKTRTIVVMVPDLANPFFAQVLAGVEEVAAEAELSVLVATTHDEEAVERTCLAMVKSRRVDGVIQLGQSGLEQLVSNDADLSLPFVHAVEPAPGTRVPRVGIDNVLAAQTIVGHLVGLGHRAIGLAAGREASESTQRRLEGYRRALVQAGLGFDPRRIEFAPYSVAGGAQAASALFARDPHITAIFAMSDEMAIGVMSAARSLGMQLPRDLSVCGFDGIQVGAFTQPSLTTMVQPARAMGQRAMELMVELMRKGKVASPEHVLATELVLRDSVAAPGRARA